MDEKVKNFLVNSLIESSVMFFILLVFWFVYGEKYSSDIFFDNEGDLYLYTFIVSAVSSMCLIKLKEEDNKILNINTWNGENLLGFILMEVRDILNSK